MTVKATVQSLLDHGMTQDEIAAALGTSQPTVSRWLKGQEPGGPTRDRLIALAREKGVQIDTAAFPIHAINARIGPKTPLGAAGETIPVYGQAIGGLDGRFVLNGNKVSDILAPPSLIGVANAYAVYVVGDSMEPRYEAGEAVYVNPGLPVRKLDWVVVQVRLQNAADGEPPAGYIKQFISKDERKTKLRQLNPDKVIEFPSDRVVSIHKIVGTATA